MKLKSLHIDTYRHLENLDFDFTYPEGHEKGGKPLEKICIIGQSATGKTSILELVRDSFLKLNSLDVVDDKYLTNARSSKPIIKLGGDLEFTLNSDLLRLFENKIQYGTKEYVYKDANGTISKLFPQDLKLIYISSEIISKESIGIFNQNPQNIGNVNPFVEDEISEKNRRLHSNYVYEFMQHIDEMIWFSLLHKILDYRKRFTQMASELINKGAIGDINKLNREYAKWSQENENPLISFSNHFNPILKKLGLEIDLVNTEYSIPIKSNLHDEVIPISKLSTGTKSLLLTMFPIYELDTNDAIILIDEPERSLFPDLQINLISHYQNLAPEAQFVVATHSPFIAAAFEPEERFILYFNEKGKVQLRRGESPIGDDPNDMLSNDFNVDYYNQFGKAAHKKYLDLKREVAQETKSERKKELIVELAELGDKYNF